jgi:hypothetical protein
MPAPAPSVGSGEPGVADGTVPMDAPSAPGAPSAPSGQPAGERDAARVLASEPEALAKDRATGNAADQDEAGQKKTFASEPPSELRQRSLEIAPQATKRSTTDQLGAAAPPSPPKTTVIKGGKETSAVPAPSAAPAPSPAPEEQAERVETKATQDSRAAQEKQAEGSASGSGALQHMYRADEAPPPPWQGIVAGTAHASRWIEILPSMFDDGASVVLAGGTTARGLGLLVDATMLTAAPRPTPLWRDAQSGRWGVAQWAYDRAPRALDPVIVKLASPRGPVEKGWTIARRTSYRDASHEVQIAFLAAEGERATAISANTTAAQRFDQILLEARRLQTRRPDDARLQRLVAALTSARANLR